MSDPTADLREEFTRDLRRRFRRLRGDIRRWIGYEEDILGLATDSTPPATESDLPDDAPQVFRFQSDREQARAFAAWFLSRTQDEVLEPLDRRQIRSGDHWTGEHVRAAFARGWRQARNRLRQQGVAVGSLPGDDEESPIEALFNLPASRRALQELYTRTYRNLESVTDPEAAQQVQSTLLEAMDEGVNPREAARRLTKEVRGIERTRANVLARTETVNAYTEATLSRYERAGVRGVSVSGEVITAGDERVCPICSAIDGRVFSVQEMRTETFEFDADAHDDAVPSDSGVYAVKPPIHPRCRCSVVPHV